MNYTYMEESQYSKYGQEVSLFAFTMQGVNTGDDETWFVGRSNELPWDLHKEFAHCAVTGTFEKRSDQSTQVSVYYQAGYTMKNTGCGAQFVVLEWSQLVYTCWKLGPFFFYNQSFFSSIPVLLLPHA